MKLNLLIVVSILTAIVWRVEIDYRWGWYSLDWIGPFHWAFPLGLGAFLAWMAIALKDTKLRVRNIIVAATCILGLVGYFGGSAAMMLACSRCLWPCPQWQALVFSISPAVLYAILGTIYFLTIHRLLSLNRSFLWVGVIVYATSFPIALILLWVIQHLGGANAINAVKSGYVFSIVVFSLGLPLLKENGQSDVSADGQRYCETSH
jgi:hypothetical protein